MRRKIFLLHILLAACLFSPVFVYAATTSDAKKTSNSKIKEEEKTVIAGVEDILQFDSQPGIVSLGDPKLIKYIKRPEWNQIRVFPQKQGVTSLTVQDVTGNVMYKVKYNITTNDLSGQVEEIRDLLFDVEGIVVKIVGKNVVIDGEIVVPHDLDRILIVQQAYKNVLNLVTLSKASQDAIATKMQEEIQRDGSQVNVRVRNDTYFLEGVVDSQSDKDRAQVIAQTYLPDVMNSPAIKEGLLKAPKAIPIRNMIVVRAAPPEALPKMVRVTFHFVEMGKEFLKSSFFKWAPLASEGTGLKFGSSETGGVAATTGGSFVGTITSLFPKLQAGTNGGLARILFSNVVIGQEGEKLDFQRQDQIPYIEAVVNGVPIPGNTPVGITTSVTPTIVGEDQVRLDTQFEFTAFSGAGAGGAPRTTTTKLKNQVIIRSGDSAVLGGLVSNDMAKDIDKDPEGGGQVGAGNPLFVLLRSKAFRSKKTQFVVFITPQIITDAAKDTQDIKNKMLRKTRRKRMG